MSIAQAALRYVGMGLSVYPADPNSKAALIKKWNDGIADPEIVAHHFAGEFRDAALGIACGPSGIVVIDVDPKNGGAETWRKICSDLGLDAFDGCPVVRTPSGGQHIYLRAPADRPITSGAHILGAGVDVLADRAGVIAPPSQRGASIYAWHTPTGDIDEFNPPMIPKPLLARIRAVLERRAQRRSLPDILHQGNRNSGLTRYAGQLRRAGSSESEMTAALLQANADRCKPPLEEHEVRTIAQSVAKYAPERDGLGWLTAWRSQKMSARELRVAIFLGTLAEHIAGPLSPAAEFAVRETGMPTNHYFAARKHLEERGAIVVHNRGRKLAPVIELRFPEAA